MDEILSKASNQAVSFAIRSGISLASGYAIKTISKFLDKIPEQEKVKINRKKHKIQVKIEIINNSIELIKAVTARGNSSLESTVSLIDDLANEFNKFDQTIEDIIVKLADSHSKTNDLVSQVNSYMNDLMDKIDDSIPLLTLSVVTSGVNLSQDLSHRISINKVILASNYLINGHKSGSRLIGPQFDMKFYSVFYNPSRLKYHDTATSSSSDSENSSIITWKEEYARSKVTIESVSEFNYELKVLENFDDDRYHEDSDTPQSRKINLKNVQKLFFSRSGQLLKLDNNNSPVLILKLIDDQYIALGELNPKDFEDSDDEDDDEDEEDEDSKKTDKVKTEETPVSIKLSLLEYMIRLCILQHTDQKCISDITDERLAIYLNNEILNPSKSETTDNTNSINETLDLNSNIKRLENLNL